MTNRQLQEKLIRIVPSARQMRQQQMEFYGFIHFSINTFTGKEWGDGTENPSVFAPEHLNAAQWTETAAAAGMKGLILTCKHHDGFCLWPSAYTEHSVKKSPYKAGKGDIVREFTQACGQTGLKAGIYVSPWDRNCPLYGYGKDYDDYFIGQLTELLTLYGPMFTVWFDGACGEGKNGKKQRYDWDRYYGTVRMLQPEATISICGPDIRWCGNEAGKTRKSEWSVVAARTADSERTAEKSQKTDDTAFRLKPISCEDEDLGSIERLKDETDFIWYPAETDVSIRPGWFYHPEEDNQVRSLDNLKDIYLKSVGGNSMLLLNIPPDKRGLIAQADVCRLKELGAFLKQSFADNLLPSAALSAPPAMRECTIANVLKDDYCSWYQPDSANGDPVKIVMEWPSAQKAAYAVIKEQIPLSQRIERFTLHCFSETGAENRYTGTTIGYKKIIPLYESEKVKKMILVFEEYRVCPAISFIGIY